MAVTTGLKDAKNAGLGIAMVTTLIVSLAAGGAREAQGREIAHSTPNDPTHYCEDAAIHHEQANGLPRALLAAVALAESGRYSPKTRTARAWPWTINAEGRAYYFKTKQEAVATTQRLLDSGMRSIDVGCMQVNLRYHPDAFATLEAAFDPMTNIAYGADFLIRLHQQTNSWPRAVANYHSQTASRGGRYFARVIRIWKNERIHVANRAYAVAMPAKIDVSGILKPAIGHAVDVTPHTDEAAPDETASIVTASYRPAPKVLDPVPGRNVRETANATVGLRLSIAEEDVESAITTAQREEPRVLEPLPAMAGPMQVADAAIPGA
ncbi:MAG: transglycosylase SLT domain-containing protein [Parvibaculum sp.]